MNKKDWIRSKNKTRQDMGQIQMANTHMKRCTNSLAVQELEIKVTMRFHFVPIRLAKVRNNTNTYCWTGWREL